MLSDADAEMSIFKIRCTLVDIYLDAPSIVLSPQVAVGRVGAAMVLTCTATGTVSQ